MISTLGPSTDRLPREWMNGFLSANLADGPTLLVDIGPFLDWLGDADPASVPASSIAGLTDYWRHALGPVRTARIIAATERLYAHLYAAGRSVDPFMMSALMAERANCCAPSTVMGATTIVDARPNSTGASVNGTRFPIYWEQEFEQIGQSGETYRGKFNWAAFFCSFWWAYYYGLNRVGTRLLLIITFAAIGSALVIGLPLSVWALVEIMNLGGRANWLRYRHVVYGEDPTLNYRPAA